jgi:uncharacterized damage-inducible protein DinB
MVEAIREILLRELATLGREVEAYPSDEAVWREAPGISNPAGTLVLHLVGNLRHFVGALLGGTGYVRDRDAEFATRGTPRAELLRMLEEAKRDVGATLEKLDDRVLSEPFPAMLGDQVQRSTGFFLVHLTQHFTYHLGQVNYHRRILSSR